MSLVDHERELARRLERTVEQRRNDTPTELAPRCPCGVPMRPADLLQPLLGADGVEECWVPACDCEDT